MMLKRIIPLNAKITSNLIEMINNDRKTSAV